VSPVPAPTAATPAGSERLRLFFALWPDDRVRAKLAAFARAVFECTGGRVMRPEGLHITLAFLGDVEAARVEALLRVAASVPVRPFDWRLDEAGFWKHNRIGWVGASAVPPPLADLVADLRGALKAGGFAFDGKPFVPHVTLVRKGTPPRELPALAPIPWRVTRFVLVKSVLAGAGSRYEIAGSWPAGPGA
jgi:2'-5' RNA ligase